MATISSPRPTDTPNPNASTTSSRRTSYDTTRTASPARSVSQPSANQQRPRNRAALRDYYGLKPSSTSLATTSTAEESESSTATDAVPESELDRPDFDAEAYVKDVLATRDLEGLLRVEAGLLGDIRSLDGERKALVYDNYSKLIAATDTIRKMRMNMDPLTPTTSTLSPAIGHIADTAAGLAKGLQDRHKDVGSGAGNLDRQERINKAKQRELVRWVLDAPERFKRLLREGKRPQAQLEWTRVQQLLDKWKGTGGVEEVRKGCEDAFKESGSDVRT